MIQKMENRVNSIIEDDVLTVTRCHHLRIEYEGELYLFIVHTTYLKGFDRTIIDSVKRGVTYWDCGLRLKTSGKKAIRKLIEEHIGSRLINLKI